MKVFLSIAFCIVAGLSYGQDDGIHFFNGTLDEALETAKSEGKNVYVDCQTSWCGPCKKMAKDIFTNKEVATYYNEHFISVSLDMEKEGKSMAKEFDVRFYPTHVYLNPARTILHNVIGFQLSDQFLETGETALNPKKRNGRFQSEFDAGNRSSEFLLEFTEHLSAKRIPSQEIFDLYLKSLPSDSLASSKVKESIFLYTEITRSFAYNQFIKIKDESPADSKYRAEIVKSTHAKIIKASIRAALLEEDSKWLESLKGECDKYLTSGDKYLLISIPQSKSDKDANGMVTAVDKYLTELIGSGSVDKINSSASCKSNIKQIKKHYKVVRLSASARKSTKMNSVAESLYYWSEFLSDPQNRISLTTHQKNRISEWRSIAYLIDKDKKYLK